MFGTARRHPGRVLAVVLGLVFLLAACGDGTTPSDPSSGSGPETAPPATADATDERSSGTGALDEAGRSESDPDPGTAVGDRASDAPPNPTQPVGTAEAVDDAIDEPEAPSTTHGAATTSVPVSAGEAEEPERVDDASPDPATNTETGGGMTESAIAEIEADLDEIERLLRDLDAAFALD